MSRERNVTHEAMSEVMQEEVRADDGQQDARSRIRLSSFASSQHDSAPGIICRKCGCRHFFVNYTRPIPGGIRRSRQCRHCGKRIITTESSG